jgi:hypothetical protein
MHAETNKPHLSIFLASTSQNISFFPDFSLPFYIMTDASGVGIGTVIYQLPNGDESKINFILFQARALHKSERNYPVYKKELLGIVFALNHFHQYIWGCRFTLYTDHCPLIYIHEKKRTFPDYYELEGDNL